MFQDYYQYLQWLQNCIQTQENKIAKLEQLVQQMADELKKLNEKPSFHVDKIEYKFDQLKVETVEGTLNIGLNPSDLQGIEDFAVNDAAMTNPMAPKTQMARAMKIEEAIFHYLETDLPSMIANTQTHLNMEPNDSYLTFIKEDIKKQLPGRIDYHLKTAGSNVRSEEDMNVQNQKISELIKQEIQNGVLIFFQRLPENMKGGKMNEF